MAIKGDFIGFTYYDKYMPKPIHSSELGIVRVTDGDRYKDSLFPEIEDVTAEVSGKDGDYFFGSVYGDRHFSLNIAYDDLTEENIRKLKQIFGRQIIGEIIFDEVPYKKYLVKLESPIELSYICFDEPIYHTETRAGAGIKGADITYKSGEPIGYRRTYKGEGTIDLIGYYPFAKSCFKVLPTNGYDNIDEWAAASKILDENFYNNYDDGHGFDKVFTLNNEYKINVYNAGDVETGCRIYCPFNENDENYQYNNLEISYTPYMGITPKKLVLKDVQKDAKNINLDRGFLINTDTGLIQGVQDAVQDTSGNLITITTNSIYNQYVVAGEFFKIQPNLTYSDGSSIIINGGNDAIKIDYNYLYF